MSVRGHGGGSWEQFACDRHFPHRAMLRPPPGGTREQPCLPHLLQGPPWPDPETQESGAGAALASAGGLGG